LGEAISIEFTDFRGQSVSKDAFAAIAAGVPISTFLQRVFHRIGEEIWAASWFGPWNLAPMPLFSVVQGRV
jgi:hypothetical protein